jgi:hypothetical protein
MVMRPRPRGAVSGVAGAGNFSLATWVFCTVRVPWQAQACPSTYNNPSACGLAWARWRASAIIRSSTLVVDIYSHVIEG